MRRFILPAVLGAAVYAASFVSRLAAGFALLGALAVVSTLYIVLPRLAHAAFERGDHARAGWLYRLIRFFVSNKQSRGAIDVSIAGCRLARSDWTGALT